MTDTHTLSGAYVLDALAPEEAEEFRQHLRGCPACRDEVAELRRAVTRMAEADASAPPPELKSRILAAADRTPQQPPPAAVATPVEDEQGAASRRRWLPRLLAAAAAVVLVGGGVWAVMDRSDDGATLAANAVQVFEAEDARTVTVDTENGGRLTVAVSPARNEMAVDTRELPDPGEDRVYQIWAVQGTEMISKAVLADIGQGAAMEMPDAETQVAFTIEPAGGSTAPTSDPIVVVDPSGLA